MSYSSGFKINVNKQNADESLLVLVRISHPMIPEPIGLVNDSDDITIASELFLAMPFKVERQSDVQGELPKASLTVSNVGRSLVKWIDKSSGGINSSIDVMIARRATAQIEETITFGISSVVINAQFVTFNLVIQNNLIKRSIRWVYDKNHAPGLF